MTDHRNTRSPGTMSPGTGTSRTKVTRPWFPRKRFTLPAAVIVLLGIITVTTGSHGSGLLRSVSDVAAPRAASATAEPATAVMGQSVRDGTFAFVVTSVQRPGRRITDRFGTTQTAQGTFVVVRVNVTNIGYEARTLAATDLYLVDAQGQRFGTSSAILALPDAETTFLHKIDPGHTTLNAPVLVDVVPGAAITSIELHDSVWSTGVRVKLS